MIIDDDIPHIFTTKTHENCDFMALPIPVLSLIPGRSCATVPPHGIRQAIRGVIC